MPRYKLTYFDIDGGRAEPIRIAFHAAGIDFEDNRISFAEFGDMRSTTPFNSVPVLETDGAQEFLTMSRQILFSEWHQAFSITRSASVLIHV